MDQNPDLPNYDITPPLENKAEIKSGTPSDDNLLRKDTNAPAPDLPQPEASPTGKDAELVDISQIVGLIEVVDTVPSSVPRRLFDQVKIYKNGGTKRLYVYDYKNHSWYYVALT